MSQKLILCGLGNPGEKYRETRHNMGFLLLEILTDKFSLTWTRAANEYSLSKCEYRGKSLIFLKPETYMNLSGEAIREFGDREHFEPRELLVMCDDFAIPLGWLRLRERGGDGGHNGLGSIIESLGSTEFPRLRMGIGPVPDGSDPAEYVLQPFLEEEKPSARRLLERAADCIGTLIEKSFAQAMTEFNVPPGSGTSQGESD